MANSSGAVVWDIVRRESSFLRRQPHNKAKAQTTELSADPTNATSINAFKFSGAAQGKSVGLVTVKHPRGDFKITAIHKTGKARLASTTLAHGRARAQKSIGHLTKYRPDLSRAVLTKYASLLKASANSKISAVPARKQRRGRALPSY